MGDRPGTFQLQFLRELIEADVIIAGDVVRIGVSTWAIHASISVDGSVLVAEYDSLEEASEVLRRLGPNTVVAADARVTSPDVQPRNTDQQMSLRNR
jgi:hypothetical protein